MMDRKLARPLIATFIVSVGIFLASSAYTQRYLRSIDTDVDAIAHNAIPSIEHLTRIRISVRALQLALFEAVHAPADERGSAPNAANRVALHASIDRDLQLYFVEPPFPREAQLWGDMRRELMTLLSKSDAVADALARTDRPAALDALDRAAIDVEDLDGLLLQAITINAVAARWLADDIAATRVAQQRVSLIANGVSVMLSIAALLLGLHVLRRYAATLHTAETNLRTLISGSPDAVLLEHDGRVVDCNDTALRLLGHSTREEVIGRTTAGILERDALAEGPPAPLQSGTRVRIPSGRRGGSLDIDVFGVNLQSERRAVRALVLRDVTSRIALEARLVMSDRLACVGTMAAGIAHEINNPLSYVASNVDFAIEELVRLEKTESRNEGAIEALRDASVGAQRVRAIVADLGMLARADHDESDDVDVHAVLDASASIATMKLRGQARLIKEYGDSPAIRGSAARLGQVILNILINAIHAVEGNVAPGEGVIRLRTSTSETGDAVIEIEDNGKGIEPGIVNRLFDPFFTTKANGVGTGLGLAISHTIISTWGGRIDVDSTVGKGTTFRVVLPAAKTGLGATNAMASAA